MFSEKNKKIRNLIKGIGFKFDKSFLAHDYPEPDTTRYVWYKNNITTISKNFLHDRLCIDFDLKDNIVSTYLDKGDGYPITFKNNKLEEHINFIKNYYIQEYKNYMIKERKKTIKKLLLKTE